MGWHKRYALALAGAQGTLRPEALNLEAWFSCSGTLIVSCKKQNLLPLLLTFLKKKIIVMFSCLHLYIFNFFSDYLCVCAWSLSLFLSLVHSFDFFFEGVQKKKWELLLIHCQSSNALRHISFEYIPLLWWYLAWGSLSLSTSILNGNIFLDL